MATDDPAMPGTLALALTFFPIILSFATVWLRSTLCKSAAVMPWSICRITRGSRNICYHNYIFILDLTPGFNGLGIESCKTYETRIIYVLGMGASYIRDFTVYLHFSDAHYWTSQELYIHFLRCFVFVVEWCQSKKEHILLDVLFVLHIGCIMPTMLTCTCVVWFARNPKAAGSFRLSAICISDNVRRIV